jgi:orotidine-5'-phosphate decarboxylase
VLVVLAVRMAVLVLLALLFLNIEVRTMANYAVIENGKVVNAVVSEPDFAAMGQKNSIEETTKSWAQIAISSGATSLVCSPFEVSALRTLSSTATLITPGVRVEGDAAGDQARIMSPSQAISAGADLVVIGRSITALWDGSDLNMRKKIDQIASTLG